MRRELTLRCYRTDMTAQTLISVDEYVFHNGSLIAIHAIATKSPRIELTRAEIFQD